MCIRDSVTNVPSHLRNVNTVFQDYALFPHMNIYKNVYFPLKMRNIRQTDADPMIREILELVEMQDFAERLPQQLSGGQRQRIDVYKRQIQAASAAQKNGARRPAW